MWISLKHNANEKQRFLWNMDKVISYVFHSVEQLDGFCRCNTRSNNIKYIWNNTLYI